MTLSKRKVTEVRNAIFRAGVWQLGPETFASGKTANNKLEMQRLIDDPDSRRPVIEALTSLVVAHNPDALWGPPKGGQDLAVLVAAELDLPVIHLDKIKSETPGTKSFKYSHSGDRKLAGQSKTTVGVEDVTTEFTSLIGALELPGLADSTAAITAIWRRGSAEQEKALTVPTEWIIEEPLPNHITADHAFFKRYGHLAIGSLQP